MNIINIIREYLWGDDDERGVGISSGATLTVFASLRVHSSYLKVLFCGRKWEIFSTSCLRTTPHDPTPFMHTGCWKGRQGSRK